MNKFASLVSGSNEDALSQIAAVVVVHRRLNKVAAGGTSGSSVPTTFGEAGTLASKAIPSALANVGYLAPLGAAAMGGLSLYRESQKPKERRRYSNALVDAGIGGALGSVPWLAGHLLANGETEQPKEPPKTLMNLPGRLPGMAASGVAAIGDRTGYLAPGVAGSIGMNRLWNMFASGSGTGNSGARVRAGIESLIDAKSSPAGGAGWQDFVGKASPSAPAKAVAAVDKMRSNSWFANRDFSLAAKHGVPERGSFSNLSRLVPGLHRLGKHGPIALDAAGVKSLMSESRGSLPAGVATSKSWRGFGALMQVAPTLWGLLADNNMLGTKE
jgi:hypothetical protein